MVGFMAVYVLSRSLPFQRRPLFGCLVCRPHKRLSVMLSENGGLREIRNTFHRGQVARTLACIEQKHLGILFLG